MKYTEALEAVKRNCFNALRKDSNTFSKGFADKYENAMKIDPTHVVVTFPEVQELMDKEGFEENSHLINDDFGLMQYGYSAYFIDVDWLNENI